MSFNPPAPKSQCNCHICRIDRDPNLFGGADILAHFNVQANKENRSDTLASRNRLMQDVIDRAMHKLAASEEGFQEILDHYEYLSFEFRIVAHNKTKNCGCSPNQLFTGGCSCGGQ